MKKSIKLIASLLLCALIVCVGCSLQIDVLLGFSGNQGARTPDCGVDLSIAQATEDDAQAQAGENAASFLVTFFDVGQGDSALVQCDGHYMLIDGGDSKRSSLLYSYLKSHGIGTLDYLVATHPDSDHTGGLSGALQVVSVGRAFCSTTEASQKAFNSMVTYLGEQRVSLEVPHAGDCFSLGSARVEVIGPVREGGTSADDGDTNDTSLMLRVTYGDVSFVFTGDATEQEQLDTIAAGYLVSADVLKVSHHGSSNSYCKEFLRAVNPSIAVISVGANNSYGHPHKRVLDALEEQGCTIYRTDKQGDIVLVSDGKTVVYS